MILTFFFKDEFKERPAIASAISSITNYSSTIPQAPGDPDAKPVEKVRGFIHRKKSNEKLVEEQFKFITYSS
jgi:hypothetical protein